MVAGKVKQAMGLSSKPDKPNPKPEKPSPKPKPRPNSFGAYFPRSSAQVQPRPPDISVPDLLNLVEELRDHESRLKAELVELKLLHETQINRLQFRVAELKAVNAKLVNERDVVKAEVEEVTAAQRFQGLVEVGNKSTLIKNLYSRKLPSQNNINNNNNNNININDDITVGDNFEAFASTNGKNNGVNNIGDKLEAFASNCRSNNNFVKFRDNCRSSNDSNNVVKFRDNLEAFAINCRSSNDSNNAVKYRDNLEAFASNNNAVKYRDTLETFASNCPSKVANEADISESSSLRCRVPRVPKPPPKSTACVSPPPLPPPPQPQVAKYASLSPPPSTQKSTSVTPPPPPPPPAPTNVGKRKMSKVKRVPEVVEFYHSLMRRDSRKESGVVTAETTTTTTCAKDLVGEIENRSAYLLAIKTDVDTQGDFIRFLIKEVETAAFTDIEDVVSFVKWLDDELSYLIDERAVLKHFDWPEQKADALREAAFEYSDLKKLEYEASSFRHDVRQPCSTTLKKMQTLLEKLEHGAYNLSRLRESASNRFKSSHIPVDWMLDTGFVSQIKLASVKLAMKYMKRVLSELELVSGGPEEEELIVQGVRFAFRAHQFAGGFDVETMTAFEELRDKARSYNVQCQKQQQERLACRSIPG